MTALQRRWLAGSLAAGLLLLLLLVAGFDDLRDFKPEPAVVLREVETYQPPPPPPPPPPMPLRDAGSTAAPSLSLASSDEPVALKVMQLNVNLPAGELGRVGNGLGGLGVEAGDGVDTQIVSLSELDALPHVVSAPPLDYPKEATERGVDQFRVMFHILIDEEGRTYPIEIVENPFPSLQKRFEEFASKVRFSPPTRLGVPVRTEYLWPVMMQHQR